MIRTARYFYVGIFKWWFWWLKGRQRRSNYVERFILGRVKGRSSRAISKRYEGIFKQWYWNGQWKNIDQIRIDSLSSGFPLISPRSSRLRDVSTVERDHRRDNGNAGIPKQRWGSRVPANIFVCTPIRPSWLTHFCVRSRIDPQRCACSSKLLSETLF